MEDVGKNIYESWLKCYNNINFITQNINVKEIHLPRGLYPLTPDRQSSSRHCEKQSYFIEDASNVTIYVDAKFNHLILNRCNTINLILNDDLISGIDIFHCNDINITYGNDTSTIITSINFGRSFNIYLLAPQHINFDLSIICTICVNGMSFIVHNTNYNGYDNLFRSNPIYYFMKMDNEKITITTIDSNYGIQ